MYMCVHACVCAEEISVLWVHSFPFCITVAIVKKLSCLKVSMDEHNGQDSHNTAIQNNWSRQKLQSTAIEHPWSGVVLLSEYSRVVETQSRGKWSGSWTGGRLSATITKPSLDMHDKLAAAILGHLCVNLCDLSRTFGSFNHGHYYRDLIYLLSVSILSLCVVPWCAQTLPPACLLSAFLEAAILWTLPKNKAVKKAFINHRWVVHTTSNASGCDASKLCGVCVVGEITSGWSCTDNRIGNRIGGYCASLELLAIII